MRSEYKEGELLTKEDIGLVFKDKDGNQSKILEYMDLDEACIFRRYDGKKFNIIACSRDSGNILYFDINGEYFYSNFYPQLNLVSFVGPDFTEKKEPRQFKFEAYMTEYFKDIHCIHTDLAIEKCLGHEHTSLRFRKDLCPNDGITSKWEITMKEIINE